MSGPSLLEPGRTYWMICDECVPFATAAAQDGPAEAGKGEFRTLVTAPVAEFSCMPLTVLSRKFDVYM